jgi:hypothetical protein
MKEFDDSYMQKLITAMVINNTITFLYSGLLTRDRCQDFWTITSRTQNNTKQGYTVLWGRIWFNNRPLILLSSQQFHLHFVIENYQENIFIFVKYIVYKS